MNGMIVVDKPAGFTSFDVVAKMRGICGTRKIGHGGTLDPMATGVLPVFLGAAAKAVDLQPRQDKTYEAVLLFGVGTDTGDITGEVLETSDNRITEQDILSVLPDFVGEQEQLPPMYSAVKVQGKPLYKYAREGKAVERRPRRITVHSLELLAAPGENRFLLRVHCSKGTYIRTLAEDMGCALGVPATLAALRRTGAGVFTLQDAHTLEDIQAARDAGALSQLVLPVERVFEALPCLVLDGAAEKRLRNGAAVQGVQAAQGRYRARTQNGAFLGLVQVGAEGWMTGEKLFLAAEDGRAAKERLV